MKIIKTKIINEQFLFPDYLDFAQTSEGKIFIRKLYFKSVDGKSIIYEYTDWYLYSREIYDKLRDRKLPYKEEKKNE